MQNENKVPVLTVPAAAQLANISEEAVIDLICCEKIKAVADAVLTWKGEDIGKAGYWSIGAGEIRQIRKGLPTDFHGDSGEVICYTEGINGVRVDTHSLQAWIAESGKAALSEKPLATTERDTLLTIIAALCDYSDIKHQARGVAVQIAKMTEEIGAAVSEDAVGRALKKIPDALERKKK